ncbi:MAG: Hpt domain-containing protein [Spirochaetales bacterium]|nr:Hpt domain-containing protein [Spirochaetales bacterium]
MIVTIDADLQPIVPGYLSRVEEEVGQMRAALENGDFLTVSRIAHNWKGSGGGYGLNRISEVGAALEEAAQRKDVEAMSGSLQSIQSFLASVDIRYAILP